MPTHDRPTPADALEAGYLHAELAASDVDVAHLLGLPLDLGDAARRLGVIARFAAHDADAELGLVYRHDGPLST